MKQIKLLNNKIIKTKKILLQDNNGFKIISIKEKIWKIKYKI